MIKYRLIPVLGLVLSLTVFASEITFNKVSGLEFLVPESVWSFTKDDSGFLWFGNNSGLYRSDGYKVRNINLSNPAFNITQVRKIFKDSSGKLWIGTKGNGLFNVINNQVEQFSKGQFKELDHISEIVENNQGIWFGINNGISTINHDGGISIYAFPKDWTQDSKLTVSSIIDTDEALVISTQYFVISFNKSTHQFTKLSITGLKSPFINTLYLDQNKNIWLGSDTGVFFKRKGENAFSPFMQESIGSSVRSIIATDKYWWFGTSINGLIQVSKAESKTVKRHVNLPKDSTSISSNAIVSMKYFDGLLFISNFYGGIDYIDTGSLQFGLVSKVSCAKGQIFYDIDSDGDDMFFVINEHVIKYNNDTGKCKILELSPQYNNIKFSPNSIFIDSFRTVWITTYKGLFKVDEKNDLILPVLLNDPNLAIHFILEKEVGTYLLGTSSGLYNFSNNDIKLKPITLNNAPEQKIKFNSYIKGTDNRYYFATTAGIFTLYKNSIELYSTVQSQLPSLDILSLYVGNDNSLWVGVRKFGLYKFDRSGNLEVRYTQEQGISERLSIFSIQNSGAFLWLSSENGLLQLNTAKGTAHTFHKSDGLQSDFFIGSDYKAVDGKLYFGGKNGFNAFYPEDIKLNRRPPHIVLTDFTRFGRSLEIGVEKNGFLLEKHIDDLEELALSHKDYVVGFEFAVLDFADPARNKYAYKLDGFDPDWTYVSADNRKAGYTNLAAGNYNFRIKGSNKDGTWNESGKSLKIKVHPAPWLTWWAYTFYILSFLFVMYWYIQRKAKANIRITNMLRAEVKKQTFQLNSQKQTVESLLAHKNEFFANVSHEFRTPLTLILGPVNELLKSSLPVENIKSLQMVNRNANRLLTMIEQLLQLAKITENQDISLVPQQIHTTIQSIVDSFQPLANKRKIKLELVQNDSCAIAATKDALDTVLSNLISNALKYTDIGGLVVVKSMVKNDLVTIEVIDDGCGLSSSQQQDIFARFHRLDTHLNTEGVGIGLSLVQEMVKLNKGHIQVESEIGKGSSFKVKFNCIHFTFGIYHDHEETRMVLTEQLKKEAINRIDSATKEIQFMGNKQQETILIIDDNQDMLDYVGKVLKQSFYCILVNRGKTGVAVAIKQVPDIIVCDVMMPEMDGFQVARTIRSDSRTSHIPFILLTALNDKKSRIKGWRENIDVYLTKPFDAGELILQLENILIIRNILKKKASQAIASKSISMTSGLAKLDQNFIDKLMKVIEKNYTNSQLLRPQLADFMAVSDRQLQRKVKALVDKNPLDLLREFRLRQAVKNLKDGYQVSQVADMCGFNSVSYFSKCFKQQYGMNPKQYQTL